MKKIIVVNVWKIVGMLLLIVFGTLYYNIAVKSIDVIDFWNEPFPVDKSMYSPGDEVKYRVEYCRYVTSVANVTAYIQKE
jgi:hypothetical protein